jgi:hypothetical protein
LAVTVPEIVAPCPLAVCAELREAHSKNPVTIRNPPAKIVFKICFLINHLIPPRTGAPVK